MNKAELVDAIAGKTGQTLKDTEETLNAVLAVITETVAKGDTIQLVGFGTFKSATRAAREGRNPQTGETLQIPETTLPKFTPGLAFKKQVADYKQTEAKPKGKKSK